jgi:prepilin-type N-terminal cleavage/methylation domain-containing protein
MAGTRTRSARRSIGRAEIVEGRRARRARRARSGFSILELIVVMIMMGVIAAMAIPRLNYDRYRADGAMRVVRTVLQGAQRNAIMRQTNIVVGFDENANLLRILEDANNNCQKDTGERFSTRSLEEGARFKVPTVPYPGTAPSTALLGLSLCSLGGLPAIEFLRDGAASSDLDVYVTSSRARATDFRMIRVTQATGRAESFRYDGTWKRYN